MIVADVLKPPTYAYGPYGSWARNPNEECQMADQLSADVVVIGSGDSVDRWRR